MSRRLIAAVVLLAPALASADEVTATAEPRSAPADMSDQGIAAMLGVAIGGRSTPGGLNVAGHYYYQLNDQDWFDGSASFIIGSGGADCFRDRMNAVICDHGPADGFGAELGAGVRHFLPSLANETFWPFARGGLGAALVRFSGDDITGIAFSLHAGAGLRASVTDAIAITGEADLQLGLGQFSNHLGGEPLLGISVSAGAEFKL